MRSRNRHLLAGELGGVFVLVLQNVRVKPGHRGKDGPRSCPNAADHLAGVFAVAGVQIDQGGRLLKDPVAELAAFVVVHTADEDDQLIAGIH